MKSVRGEKPLEVTDEIFVELSGSREGFADKVRQHYRCECARAAYRPIINENRLIDAFLAFQGDKTYVGRSLPSGNDDADHFKLSGLLVFWLRRFALVDDLQEMNAGYSRDEELASVLVDYPSELLAFDLGLTICDFFQSKRKDGASAPFSSKGDSTHKTNLNRDYLYYLQTVCYMMKFKNVSPHSMGLIYRSLYTDPNFFATDSDS